MGHTRDYTEKKAVMTIDAEGFLLDKLSYDPSWPAGSPNGRLLTGDALNDRLTFLSKDEIPHDGLKLHTDILSELPLFGTHHAKAAYVWGRSLGGRCAPSKPA